MRYAIISKGMDLGEMEAKCRAVGATGVKSRPLVRQVFCNLDPGQAAALSRVPGLVIKPVKKVVSDQITFAPARVAAPLAKLHPQQAGLSLYSIYNPLRELYTPILDGIGLTVAVLDSGIRTTHESLLGKVIYEKNFSTSGTLNDIFGHGTGLAYIIAGEYGLRSGVATGAKLMSIKILNDSGEGTDETLVDGIEEVCEMVEAARDQLLPITDEMYPNSINLSVGGEDDGDYDNPMRAAARIAILDYGVEIIAAAGNGGPDMSTILCPACEPLVIAVGGIKIAEFIIWEKSSRGPTEQGEVKPDLVCWAEDIEVASHRGDSDYDVKSGTSFSTPILVGADGIIWDLTRRIYGGDVRITYSDWLQYAAAYCVKPEGAPIQKDNSYGYGVPALGNMVTQLMRPASPVGGVMQMMPVMMMMGMIPAMMGGA